jgi:hypothetical protein
LEDEVPLAGRLKRCGDIGEEISPSKPARDAGAAIFVAFRRECNRAQRRRLWQGRLDETRVQDHEDLIAARPSSLRDTLEKRAKIYRCEATVALGEPAEIPEFAAQLSFGARRAIPPEHVHRLAADVRSGIGATGSANRFEPIEPSGIDHRPKRCELLAVEEDRGGAKGGDCRGGPAR